MTRRPRTANGYRIEHSWESPCGRYFYFFGYRLGVPVLNKFRIEGE